MSGIPPADNFSTATTPRQFRPVRPYYPPMVPQYGSPRSKDATTASAAASNPPTSTTSPTTVPTNGPLPPKTTPDPQSLTVTSNTAVAVKTNSRSFPAPLNPDTKPPSSTGPPQRRVDPYLPPTIPTYATDIQRPTTMTTKAGSYAHTTASKTPTSTTSHSDQRHKYIEPHYPPTVPTYSSARGIAHSVANKSTCPKFSNQYGSNLAEHFVSQPRSDATRAPQLNHSLTATIGSTGAISASAPFKAIHASLPPMAASPPSSVPVCNNGYRDSRDQDSVVVVRDRKVRISNESSLYALCRSWLRNGSHEESQTQFGNGVKCLPRPQSALMDAPSSPNKRGRNDNEGKDEEEESADNLSPQELLQRHVIHARSIRGRLREERLRRIARYKTRLATLLHPQMEHK